jgi:hypothetical protein
MRKQIIIILVIVIAFASCTSDNDYFEINAGEFSVSFINESGDTIQNFTDSIKINTQTQRSITVMLSGAINEYYVSVDEKYTGSLGSILLNGNSVDHGESIFVDGKYFTLGIIADQAKKYEGYLVIGDNTDDKIFPFSIVAFENMLPVAKLNISKLALNSPYEISIDATQSFDQDNKFGGEIVEWEYTIGNFYTYTTTEYSSIYHILPTSGSYTISLRVRDNDGAWSNTIYETVTL